MKKYQLLLSLILVFAAFALVFGAVHAQEESFDIELAQNEPVLASKDLPFSTAASSPFQEILALQNGFFAVSGALNTNVGLSPRGVFAGYGQYLVSSNGEVLDIRHVGQDGGRIPQGVLICGKGWYSVGSRMEPVDGSSFIRDTAFGNLGPVLNNPPIYYRATNSGLNPAGKAFEPSLSPDFCGRLEDPHIDNVVYAGGRAVGLKLVDDGSSQTSGKVSNVVMALPSFAVVNEISQPEKRCDPGDCSGTPRATREKFIPVLGLGDYMIASEVKFSSINPLTGEPFSNRYPGSERNIGSPAVYRVQGDEVIKVQDLLEPEQHINERWGIITHPAGFYARDVLDPNRVAIVVRYYDGGTLTVGNTSRPSTKIETRIYRAGTSGLVLEETFEHIDRPLALMGDYIAYRDGGELVVEKDGEKVSIEPLPQCDEGEGSIACRISFGDDGESVPQPVTGAAFSPNGRLLVIGAPPGGGEWHGGAGHALWLYQIKDFEAPTSQSTPSPSLPTFDFNQATVDVNDFLNSAQSYINSLLEIFGTQSATQTQSQTTIGSTQYTLNRPPETIAEIRQFQCAYNIVCSGTIETTGYGNLGPITRAKIEEVFGPQGY